MYLVNSKDKIINHIINKMKIKNRYTHLFILFRECSFSYLSSFFLAVPSLNLKPKKSIATHSRSKWLEEKKRRDIVSDLINPGPCDEPVVDENIRIAVEPELESQEESFEVKYKKLLSKHNDLKRKYKVVLESNQNLERESKHLKLEVNSALEKLKVEEGVRQSLEKVLETSFSATQIKLMSMQKKRVTWHSDDISKAFAIRYLSKRCYIYLRNTLKYPLPHIDTLKKWASKLKFDSGILSEVLRIIQVAGLSLTDFEKIIVLQFDEMKVSSVYEYDKKRDQIKGPHNYMQTVMARGLFKKWKQPIFIDFDKKMTPAILNEVIIELHKIGYTVVACVSDCGGGNVGLWKQLGISTDKVYFLHPVSGKKIFMFADAPHLLKLLRNWLLDTGFILKDGKVISRKPLDALLQRVSTEITVCHKLTTKHLNCEKALRQNVGLAAQLLSHTTATALLHYLPGSDKKLASDTGHFIELVSNWFDILISYTARETLCTKKPYGLNFEKQNEVLNSMTETVGSMLCVGKSTLQIFQKGILITTKSLQELFNMLIEDFDIKYLITSRLNQDGLENSFGQIRNIGGLHDHPSPLNAIHRFRLIVLGKNPGILQEKTNTEHQSKENDEDEYLVAHVMHNADIPIQVGEEGLEDDFSIFQTSTQISENSSDCSSVSSTSGTFSFNFISF